MEFVILAGAIIVGFYAGWQFRELWAIRQVKRLLEDGDIKLNKVEDEGDVDRMELERHGEVIYAFTSDDHSFIAQGKDLKELDSAIQKRFPGRKFLIRESNLNDLGLNHDTI